MKLRINGLDIEGAPIDVYSIISAMAKKTSTTTDEPVVEKRKYKKRTTRGGVRKKYTEQETQFIRDNIDTKTISQMAKELGRTPGSVYMQAKKQHIVSKRKV